MIHFTLALMNADMKRNFHRKKVILLSRKIIVKKRFKEGPDLLSKYSDIMKKQEKAGILEKIPKDEEKLL